MTRRHRVIALGMVLIASAIGGCAGGPGAGADGIGLASGAGCKSIESEIRKYEARGIQYKADAAARGTSLSAKQKADVQRYNSLLDSYLGSQCHV